MMEPRTARPYTERGSRGAVARVTVTLSEEGLAGLDARAAELGISRSLALEQAIRAWVAPPKASREPGPAEPATPEGA